MATSRGNALSPDMTKPRANSVPARRRIGHLHYSAIELLGTLVLLIVLAPILEELRGEGVDRIGLLTLVFGSSVFVVGARRSTGRVAGILMVLAIAARASEQLFGPAFPLWIYPPFALGFVGFVIIHLVRSTLEAREVELNVLCTAISAYLMLGLLWAMAYILVGRFSPDAFAFATGPESGRTMNRFNAFYFSFATLSTVGYGDIAPVSKAARMLAAAEAMSGMLYVAVLNARLVSLYSARNPKPPDQE